MGKTSFYMGTCRFHIGWLDVRVMGQTGFLNKVGMERKENDQWHGGHWEKEECMIHDMTRCIRLGEGKKRSMHWRSIYTGTINAVCPLFRTNAQGDMFSREVPVCFWSWSQFFGEIYILEQASVTRDEQIQELRRVCFRLPMRQFSCNKVVVVYRVSSSPPERERVWEEKEREIFVSGCLKYWLYLTIDFTLLP